MSLRTSNPGSPKVTAAALGAAASTIFWVVAAATFWKGTFDDTQLSALTGSTATILALAVGYLVKDSLRERGIACVNHHTSQGPGCEKCGSAFAIEDTGNRHVYRLCQEGHADLTFDRDRFPMGVTAQVAMGRTFPDGHWVRMTGLDE